MTTLHLWVNNMPTDFDATAYYIDATRFRPLAGVTYDADAQTLSGADPEAVFGEFRRLAAMVARAGHGADIEDADPPVLTACPAELIEPRWTCAAESLARLTCGEHDTFAAWRRGFATEGAADGR